MNCNGYALLQHLTERATARGKLLGERLKGVQLTKCPACKRFKIVKFTKIAVNYVIYGANFAWKGFGSIEELLEFNTVYLNTTIKSSLGNAYENNT